MNEGRKRRQAKQARRDTRRRATGHRQKPEQSPLMREVREALDTGHPLNLLVLVSALIEAATPRPAGLAKIRPARAGPSR